MIRSNMSALSAAVILTAVGAAHAQTINFDTLPGGAPVPANTLITTQYAALGVTFASPAPAGGAIALSNGEASSGPNFLVGLDANLGGIHPITMDFTAALASSFGVTLISVGCGTVTATAYASDLTTVLDSVSVTHGPSAGVGFGNQDSIVLSAGSGPGIARVMFSIAQTGPVADGFGIDDITFTAVPAPGALAIAGLGGLFAARRRRN